MRCPDCNKFVSYDEPEVEVNSVDLEQTKDGVQATADLRVVLKCADCGTELKALDFNEDASADHTCPAAAEAKQKAEHPDEWKAGQEDGDKFDLEGDGNGDGTSRLETQDRHGKPIKSRRYMTTYYGFTLEPDIRCRCCGEQVSLTIEGEASASSFEEQV
jgi:hypothetical protein